MEQFGLFELLFAILFRIVIWIFYMILDKQVPIIRHIDEDELWQYRYPSMASLFPKFYLYLFITLVPLAVLFVQLIFNRREKSNIADIISTIIGLSLAYCINGVFTSTLKVNIGRPRPNFFLRCFPDGYGTNLDECTGEYQGLMDGRKSFPSGHASFAFTSMVYLTLHLRKLVDLKKPRFLRGIIIFLMFMPILSAMLIAVSRVTDYHHHFSDIIGGAILGSTIAYIVQDLYAIVDTEAGQKMVDMVERYSFISMNLD
ncbi:hypothetical protein JTB14_025242 [Gonioctena quinquepunctata]|nr:hypothetical protein JTB14_025242 [Gonioctena quinquepunctata]